MINTSERKPTTVIQKGANQLVIAAPLASLFGYYISVSLGMPDEVVIPAVAVFMAVVTTAGNFLRNVFEAKGWTKYIG
jgi:hypothetical protein